MITYPVNVADDRFTFKLGMDVQRRKRWPRADGMQLQSTQPGLVILQEFLAAEPAYNPATHKLGPGGWVDDEPNQTATWTLSVVAFTQAELDERADTAAREAKRVLLKNGIATMRTWAEGCRNTTVTSGNAVATLQTTLTRLAVFFDGFSDLLEVLRLDHD